MRLVFFGSGEFGLPTLRRLVAIHEVKLVVTQPDRPAGRRRELTPTTVAAFAARRGVKTLKPEQVNSSEVVEHLRSIDATTFVVIAYGQKLGRRLLQERFAINLHGSVLPRLRGAAPVNWAIIRNEPSTGVTVITLAERMDSGEMLGQIVTPIDPMETAGELHDRLSKVGPELVLDVLDRFEHGRLRRVVQDDRSATAAPKLVKADGTVNFDQPAELVRARVHGLTPWPGCRVRLGANILRLHRVRDERIDGDSAVPGTILADGRVACASGCVQVLAVHPPGGQLMSWEAFRAGHEAEAGMRLRPLDGPTE